MQQILQSVSLSETLSETTKYLLIFADKSGMIKTYLVYQQINIRKDMG